MVLVVHFYQQQQKGKGKVHLYSAVFAFSGAAATDRASV